MSSSEKKMLDELWKYPLFEALARRRGIRFGRGEELKDCPYPYKSDKSPVALSELENALLCWAGHGITGTIMGEIDVTCNTFNEWIGRTHPNPCNDQRQELMFFNDDGLFLYRPKPPKSHVVFQTADDRENILTQYSEGLVKLQDGRPDFHDASLMKINLWDTLTIPGTTTFIPVIDTVYEYINFMFMAFDDDGWQIVDDRTGKAAGVQKWIDSGFLNGPTVPLSMLDMAASALCVSTAHYMLQNLGLAATAMGLNGFVWGGKVDMVMLGGTPLSRGLGFRYITGKDKMPTPVGRDGSIEPLTPPYVKNMDEAVDKYWEEKFGSKGIYDENYPGLTPWKDQKMNTKIRRPSEESKECVKAFLNYCHETYGRFPATVDAIATPALYTVHHADFDFYKKYYPEELITDNMKNHMDIWHGQK